MARFTRREILAKFQDMISRNEPIIGAGAGTGLSAKCEEAGGMDLIGIYNSGRYRMAGRGSLAGLLSYGNANDIVLDMSKEVIPMIKHTPIIAGVNGTDPFCDFDVLLNEMIRLGFSGVQNFPTVGLIDGNFRKNLEETGMSYSMEVDMIRLAHEKDLLTIAYVFSREDAIAMAEAGADIIAAHMGLTTGGSIGAETALKLEDCVPIINDWYAAARTVRDDFVMICHGGPISTPADAEYILKNCPDCHGFYGASSMERLPTEIAMTNTAKEFKSIRR